ncbi:Uncharacterised protein [Mycobacteroides abscessus subsp. massiliense]|nr:Uncharacterised protein [Mycobacteroides abscessus subsp. abscessus]SKV98048.1 Uncharacterised protein [Mycobacteroides abscessus subsp. massiliense]
MISGQSCSGRTPRALAALRALAFCGTVSPVSHLFTVFSSRLTCAASLRGDIPLAFIIKSRATFGTAAVLTSPSVLSTA